MWVAVGHVGDSRSCSSMCDNSQKLHNLSPLHNWQVMVSPSLVAIFYCLHNSEEGVASGSLVIFMGSQRLLSLCWVSWFHEPPSSLHGGMLQWGGKATCFLLTRNLVLLFIQEWEKQKQDEDEKIAQCPTYLVYTDKRLMLWDPGTYYS